MGLRYERWVRAWRSAVGRCNALQQGCERVDLLVIVLLVQAQVAEELLRIRRLVVRLHLDAELRLLGSCVERGTLLAQVAGVLEHHARTAVAAALGVWGAQGVEADAALLIELGGVADLLHPLLAVAVHFAYRALPSVALAIAAAAAAGFQLHQLAGVSRDNLMKILDSATTTEAIAYLEEEKKTKPVMDYLMERIIYYTNKRAGGKMKIECILYDNQYGELAKSEGAEEFLYELQHENVNANETTI